MEIQVSGGCGTHDFDLLVNETFDGTVPEQLSNTLSYQNNDSCEAMITVNKSFDLEPIAEIYRRAFPYASGTQMVQLTGIGTYTFTL